LGNWSGYVADDEASTEPFTEVQGEMQVPAISCTTANDVASFWVGLGGDNQNTLEQDGIDAYCGYSSGCRSLVGGKCDLVPGYSAWWEMVPWQPNDMQPVSMPISQGDTIYMDVKESKANFYLTVKDETTGQSFTKVKQCLTNPTCSRQTADWIVERPTFDYGQSTAHYEPLADWGSTSMYNDIASDGGLASLPIADYVNTPLYLENNNSALLAVSGTQEEGKSIFNSLQLGTDSFTDYWGGAQ
jgi:hypothetical protein